MWSISVEPTPSRITRPCFSCHRYQTSAGSGSAAEMHNLTDEKSPSCSSASIALYSVGTEKNNLGWKRSTAAKTASGVGRPLRRTVVAPAQYGKERLLPRPYAWKSFVVENVTSSSVMPRTCRAYVSHV